MYLQGVSFHDAKWLDLTIKEIYGVGDPGAKALMSFLGCTSKNKIAEIDEEDLRVLRDALDAMYSGFVAKQMVTDSINRYISNGSYRGLRHQLCKPVRGQRTQSNAMTQRRLGAKRGFLVSHQMRSKKNMLKNKRSGR